ncbi:glutamate-1-semialdehyde 2,1-aminomutase, partial [Chlamydiales bacterium]|nr:glutamate-1-semialdehyde 2,1-aminomutase [Chlamydiales bacterium]
QSPLIISHGKGATITDVDGHTYIDYCGSWGPLIHGHAHPEIIEKVQKRLSLGTSFGISTEIELDIAEEITRLIPSIESIRFVNSGTEATMTALRLARGFTNRPLILKFAGHYHGHADFLLVSAGSGLTDLNQTSSSLGIPDDMIKQTLVLPFNDLDALEELFKKHGSQIAAVILEPIAANMGVVPPIPQFLETVRDLTETYRSLLIYDEVITGFRTSLQGAQGTYPQVTPDLTCFGKIMGGGFPAAAFGGKKEIMDHLAPLGGVYQAGTLSGNPVAMEAGLQSLKLLQAPNFYENLQEKTDRLTKPLERYIAENNLNACLQKTASMFSLFFGIKEVKNFRDVLALDTDKYKDLFQFLFNQGIYPPPLHCEAWFISSAHTNEQIDQTSNAILKFLETVETIP